MKAYPLPLETMTEKDATHAVDILFSDLTAAAAAQTLSPFTVADKMGVRLVGYELVTPFVSSDGTLISTAITVGDTGSAARFMGSTEMNAAGAFVKLKGGALNLNAVPFVYTAADTVQVAVAGTGGKLLSSHTAGKVILYFNVTDARYQP